MARTRTILTLMFVLTLAAGVSLGVLASTRWLPPASAQPNPPVVRTPLGAELGLTPAQNARLQRVWEDVRDKVDDCFVRAQDVQKRRDAILLGLLTDEQRAKFATAQKAYADAFATIKAERDQAFRSAVRQTEGVLDEAQRKRYREILQNRFGPDAALDDSGVNRITAASTQPATTR